MTLILIVLLAQSMWFASSQGVTITVTSLIDDGSGVCPGANCTLRAALLAAADDDTIDFAVSGTIFVNDGGTAGGPLPALTANNVTIDGNEQITLDGSMSPAPPPPENELAHGLRIDSNGNRIFGLEITQFDFYGLVIVDGDGNQIGGTGSGQGNHIHLNGDDGIVLVRAGTMASPNIIEGNLIGTDATGSSSSGNGANGIRLTTDSNFNRIGGPGAAANIISGNGRNGITVDDNSHDNTIEGNWIGIDGQLGTTALGNTASGIHITPTSSANLIQGNTISGNGAYGIWVQGSHDNQIISNIIGLDGSSNTLGIGNSELGIQISTSNNTVVSGNTIADNVPGGILINFGAVNTSVTGNRIGLAADGTTAVGNGAAGIELNGADNTIISGNTIAANAGTGIRLENFATMTIITNNVIGQDEAGGIDGNAGSGIQINGMVTSTQITGNTIANSGGDGVTLTGGNRNTIMGNLIFDNVGLGIDIAPNGVNPNDNDDGDGGPNRRQNFPVIAAAEFDGTTTTTITGTLNSNPGEMFDLEFFVNAACDSSNHGEGETPLTTVSVTTGSGGNASYSLATTGLALGDWITATATNSTLGTTSEFSRCVQVALGPPIAQFSADPTSGDAPLTVVFTDESTGMIDTYLWQFGDGQTSNMQNPTHVYTSPGTYTARLTLPGRGERIPSPRRLL